jgi:flavin reductase (DIM6/NTAB) family NADH-FMN oxidoreductase RutF
MKFRDVMSLVSTNVSVLSCIKDQLIYGCTISSLVSVNISDELPEILFVLKSESIMGNLIESNKFFSINLLNSRQKQIAEKFANNRPPDNFEDGIWNLVGNKFAELHNARAVMNCAFVRRYIDHGADIFVGNVQSYIGSDKIDGLLYDSRRYGSFLPDMA